MELPVDNVGVYQITCTVTGDSYIGASSNIYSRLGVYLGLLKGGSHFQLPKLQELYNLHGPSGFKITLLELCDPRYLLVKETKWIRALSPTINIVKDSTRMGTSIPYKQESDI